MWGSGEKEEKGGRIPNRATKGGAMVSRRGACLKRVLGVAKDKESIENKKSARSLTHRLRGSAMGRDRFPGGGVSA